MNYIIKNKKLNNYYSKKYGMTHWVAEFDEASICFTKWEAKRILKLFINKREYENYEIVKVNKK